MKRVSVLVVLVVVAAGAVAIAAAPQRNQIMVKGQYANGSIWSPVFDEWGMFCGEQYFSANLVDAWQKPGDSQPTTTTAVNINFFRYNWCTGQQDSAWGFVEGVGTFGKNLSSASVAATIPHVRCEWVCDPEPPPCEPPLPGDPEPPEPCPPPCYEVCTESGEIAFSLEWTAFGDTYRGMQVTNNSGPGFRSHFRGHGSARQATFAVDLTVDGQPVVFDAEGGGEIGQSNAAQLEIYRY